MFLDVGDVHITSLDYAHKSVCVILTISTVFYFSRDNLILRYMGGVLRLYCIEYQTRIRLVHIVINVSARNGVSHDCRGGAMENVWKNFSYWKVYTVCV